LGARTLAAIDERISALEHFSSGLISIPPRAFFRGDGLTLPELDFTGHDEPLSRRPRSDVPQRVLRHRKQSGWDQHEAMRSACCAT
jgi:hypothetical protein